MLRISTVETRTERRLVVEGSLVDPWLSELRTSWISASENLGERKLLIDLSGATVIGREGQELLFDLMQEGARFSCGGVLTRYVLKRLASRCRRKDKFGAGKELSSCL